MQIEAQTNRRLFRRFHLGIEVEIDVDGEIHKGRLYDISFGGASVAPADKTWLSKRIVVRNGGLGQGVSLPGDVLNVVDDRCHLRFDLDAAAEDDLTFFLMANDGTRI
jgi:hypothetical protein